MSLFSSIQIARNSLIASQIGLQVTGNNVANANTPGYIRQEMLLAPGPTQELGNVTLGLGVRVTGVVQQLDRFLEERLRGATSDLANGEAQENVYVALESLVNELSETDLSTSLNSFFGSIHDILNQPESIPVRNLAMLQGRTLTHDIRSLDERAKALYRDMNDRLTESAAEVNRLLEQVAKLNVQVVTSEASDTSRSDAVGLRDQRLTALNKLSELMDIRVVEQPSGAMTVFSGGIYVVFEGAYREVSVEYSSEDELVQSHLRLAEIDAPLAVTSGKIAGLIRARDEILTSFIDRLEGFSKALIYEFNKSFSSGQGMRGYSEITSEFKVDDADAALDQAGLTFNPSNGSFQVLVYNNKTKKTETTDIFVELHGLDTDTTLSDLVSALDAVNGIAATIEPNGSVRLTADSGDIEIAFARDTSGVLASLGINTFFSGSSATDINVHENLRRNPSLFAASRGGVGADSDNAVELASFLSKRHSSQDGQTLEDLYDQMTGEVMQGAAVTRSLAEGFRVFQKSLEGQKFGISGVNLDEEAVRMITYQRAFQASARFISTVSDLLDDLVHL